MPVIHLIGPNAIGKTTALRRWAQRYGSILVPIHLDLLRKPGYDTSLEKSQRVAEWRESSDIVVVESARTSQLSAFVSCDTKRGVLIAGGEEQDQPGWKGDKDNRQAMLSNLRSQHPISVVESARTTTTTTTMYAASDDPVIIVTCQPLALIENLKARCAGKNKKFRDDCWTVKKCSYEGSRRYLTFAKKYLKPSQTNYFEVNDYSEWSVVDEFFGKLFRRIHNRLNRGQR